MPEKYIGVEDVLTPFRTYAWAITGSVSQADQILIECFEGISQVETKLLPTSHTQWFTHIDSLVIEWVCKQKQTSLEDNYRIAQTIETSAVVEPGLLFRLLEKAIKIPNTIQRLNL